MLSNLNEEIKSIIEILNREKSRFGSIGSEALLLGLAEIDASCSFILEQYGINQYTITKELDKLIILRKPDTEYTSKFNEIMAVAYNSALLEDEKEVFDDHLLFALLTIENSVALDIIKNIGANAKDILDDLNSIYNINLTSDLQNNYLFNLTKEIKLGKLNPFIGREDLVDKVIRILSKKQKNNPMLIGSAGVGKSALVEGVANKLIKTNPNLSVYRLDLGTIIAGTKYRGDLEERFIEVLEKIKNPNTIIFIDEIHNIVGSGSSEGTLDIANILKPILSRSEIKCIGATTLDEYYRFIDKDKALSRRFQNVFIEETSEEEALEILEGIVHCYEEFHQVKYNKEVLKYIISSSSFLANRKLPDKAIDILDEAGLFCKIDKRVNVETKDVDKIVFETLGIKLNNISKSFSKIKNFPILIKYYQLYFMNLGIRKTILNVQIVLDSFDLLMEDLKTVFNIENEVVLNLDLSSYDNHYASSLIGSPAGYVGYSDGGILTEHVIKFPLSVIVIKNYLQAGKNIKTQIDTILENGKILDSKGRMINFRNTIFIFLDSLNDMSIGFIEKEKKQKSKINNFIDEVITEIPKNHYYRMKIDKIIKRLKEYNYYIDIDCSNMGLNTYKNLISKLSDLDNFEIKKKYLLECSLDEVNIKVLK